MPNRSTIRILRSFICGPAFADAYRLLTPVRGFFTLVDLLIYDCVSTWIYSLAMRKVAPLFVTVTTAALLFFGLAAAICAQNPMTPVNPTMPSQERETQKDALYSEYYEHRKMPSAEHQRIAYELGKDYLRRYGGDDRDSDVKAVQKFVAEYERVRLQYELDTAYSAKNYGKAFEIGRPLLKANPADFYFLALLVEAGYENALAGDTKLNAETIDCARRAIQVLEGGKLTKADPFKSIELARGFLNFALGWFVRDQAPVEAAAAFRKAAQSDSPYRNDPQVYYRLGIAILKGEFAQLSAEYNERFGNKPPSEEQQALLARIQKLAEQAIDVYARAVALSTTPQQQEARSKILAQLTALYKSFHNNSDAGLNELIAAVLNKPLR